MKNSPRDGATAGEGDQSEDRFHMRRGGAERSFGGVPRRAVLALMMFSALFITFWMKDNLEYAIEHIIVVGRNEEWASINWTQSDVDLMARAEYWGSAIGQIPGALMVIRFSAYRMIAVSVALTSVLHMAVPLTLHHNVAAIVVIDFLRGLLTGPMYAACIDMWKTYAPPRERARLVAITFSGVFLGYTVSRTTTFYLIETLGEFAGFFISAVIGIIWSLLWFLVINETPDSDLHMTSSELAYLEQSIPSHIKREVCVKDIPLKAILTSVPVIVFLLAYMISTIAVQMSMLNVVMDLIQHGTEVHYLIWDADLPKHMLWVSAIVSGFVADFVVNRNLSSLTFIRKITCAGALSCSGIAFSVSMLLHVTTAGYAAALTLSLAFLGYSISGLTTNVLDLSPSHACLLIAFGETLSYAIDILIPYTIDAVLNSENMNLYWMLTKGVMVFLMTVAAGAFAVWGSVREQPWSGGEVPGVREPQGSTYYPAGTDAADESDLVSEQL